MNKLIEDYYLRIKHKEGITIEECEKICTAPFLMVKEIMSKNIFTNIRLKYFGIFKVSSARINFAKKHLKRNLEKGLIEEEHYNKRIKVLNNYTENEELER